MQAIAWIAKRYAIESQFRDAPPDQRHRARAKPCLGVLAELHTWPVGHLDLVPPKASIAGAMGYALNHWTALTRYLQHPSIEIDNNRYERALRPVALGRKNFLYSASERGGHTATIAYLLIETAKIHRVEPIAYLTYLFTRLPSHPSNRLHELMPRFCGPLPQIH